MNGLIVDLFAGGGGASTGIKMATGRSPDVAINHDAEAVSMHAANHPETEHICGDVWHQKPMTVTGGRPVSFLWASPDCTHHSRARGGKPHRDPDQAKNRRALADVVVTWAKDVRPTVLGLENVAEFCDWGPLGTDGKPDKAQAGLEFRRWVGELRALGYEVEWRELRACDYGAPTSRNRLYLGARCDRSPIVWPSPTHGRGLLPYRTAAECIDWTIPVPSIFDRKKPLVDNTLARIARGIDKFVFGTSNPFVVPMGPALGAPTLIQTGYGEREGQAPRILDLHQPLTTVVAGGVKHALAVAFMAKHFGGNGTPGGSLALPMSTVTTKDHHALVTASLSGLDRRREVRAFLTQYNGTSIGQGLQLPLGTITTKDRFGLVYVDGTAYEIFDIGMRMLTPRELYRAQGFPESYIIDRGADGRPLTGTAQVRMCGNSVCPPVAEAIVRANLGIGGEGQVAA
jgi:DNA (cytosine-5)-methyltransferase 1